MRIIIIGGGTGGIIFANSLVRKLPSAVEVILIEKKENHYFQPGFTLLCFQLIEEKYISKPIKELLSKKVNFINEKVIKVNPSTKELVLSSNKILSYDILIIATGVELDWDKIPGIKEGLQKDVVHEFYTLSGAKKLQKIIPLLEGGVIVSAIGRVPIKCPAAPIKFLLLLEDFMRKKGRREKFHFIFVTPSGQLLGRSPYAETLEDICKKRKIEVVKNFQIKEIDVDKRKIIGERGEIVFDNLIFTPPHTVNKLFSEIPNFLDETGFIEVDPYTLEHQVYKDHYALGDVAGLPTAKTASGARLQARILAQRIISLIEKGDSGSLKYDGEILCPVMTKFGKIMFSKYNYEKSLSPPKETTLNWFLHVTLSKYLYWSLYLKGF